MKALVFLCLTPWGCRRNDHAINADGHQNLSDVIYVPTCSVVGIYG
jgi:hypothetical protein